jgi:hypothetical protein
MSLGEELAAGALWVIDAVLKDGTPRDYDSNRLHRYASSRREGVSAFSSRHSWSGQGQAGGGNPQIAGREGLRRRRGFVTAFFVLVIAAAAFWFVGRREWPRFKTLALSFAQRWELCSFSPRRLIGARGGQI